MNSVLGVAKKINKFFIGLSKRIEDSLLVRFFCADKSIGKKINNSQTAKYIKKSDLFMRLSAVRLRTVTKIEESKISLFYRKIITGLLNTSSRVYATFFISFALYTVAVVLIQSYAFKVGETRFEDLALAAFFMLIGIMLMISERSFIDIIRRSSFFRGFLVKVLGIREAAVKPVEKQGGAIVAFIIGTISGVMTVFTDPLYVVLGLLTVAAALLVFYSPECGVLLVLLFMPFVGEAFIFVSVAFTFLSYLTKVFRYKRNLKLGGAGGALLLLMLNTVLCGLLTTAASNGITEAVVLTSMMTFYYLAVNLICTDKLVFCALRAILIGSFFCSVLIILKYFIPEIMWLDISMPENVSSLTAVFTVAVGGVLFMQRSLVNYNFFSKSASFVCFLLTVAALYFNGAMLPLLLLIVGAAAICIFLSPGSIVAFIAVGATSPLWWRLVADTAAGIRLTEMFTGAGYGAGAAVNSIVYNASLNTIAGGVGTGNAAVVLASGIEPGQSGTLYGHLLLQGGIVHLLLFTAVMVMVAVAAISGLKIMEKKSYKALTWAFLCIILAFLITGGFGYIWMGTASLPFWAVCGLACSAGRNFSDTRENMLRI